MKKLTFFTLLLSCFLLSCEKEKLTKVTHIGANTFSCKVDGKVYVASSELFSPAFTGGFYNSTNNNGSLSLFSTVRSKDNNGYDILIKIPVINRLGIYNLNSINFNEVNPLPITINGNVYSTKNTNIGEVTITFIDYEKRILSGTFFFTAINTKDNSDQLVVSEGRFDIQTK